MRPDARSGPPRDMERTDEPASMEGARPEDRAAGAGALAPEEFARRWQAAGRLLWTIAAGVLGERTEVDDVLQEACVAALEKLDHYREDVSFGAWAGRFVRHAALNHGRKRARRATRTVGPDELEALERGGASARLVAGAVASDAGAGAGADAAIDARGALAGDQTAFDDALLAALGELGATQRAALLLRAVHELSYRELSLVLEIPEGTAMSHVHRARAALREALFARSAGEGDGRRAQA